VRLGGPLLDSGPPAGEGYDSTSLFWRHERLHRIVLNDYHRRKELFDEERRKLQQRINGAPDLQNGGVQHYWDEHREAIPEWTTRLLSEPTLPRRARRFDRYWQRQNLLDALPGL
jgi:hypothetical protein